MRARAAIGAALCGAALALAACAPRSEVARPEGLAPTAADVERHQSARLAALPSFALRGHAEIRWREGKTEHFDDGDFDLVARPPSEMSLRLSKLGERVLWIGSGEGMWWTVFPRDQPSRAVLRDWLGSESEVTPVDGTLTEVLSPHRLFEALGLAPIAATEVVQIDWDAERGAWAITLRGRRVFARGESLLPVAVEWFGNDGSAVASCELDAFQWPSGVSPAGASDAGAKPLLATRMRIASWGSAGGSRANPDSEASLAAETPSFGADRIKPQIFRWADVQAALRPEVVERSAP